MFPDRSEEQGLTPLERIQDLSEGSLKRLREKGVLSCEQLYALLCLKTGRGGSPLEGFEIPEVSNLKERLEAVLPEERRRQLSEAAVTDWLRTRRLGVLPPDPKMTGRLDLEDKGHGSGTLPQSSAPDGEGSKSP